MDINKYLVDADSVGDWNGQEQLIADNFNRIYQALDLRIGPILVVGSEQQWDPNLYDDIMGHVRGAWVSKDKLLSLTDAQIEEYVESQAAAYHIPPVPQPVVDNVEIVKEPEATN